VHDTDWRTFWVLLSSGLGTIDHDGPFQVSIRVSVVVPLS
jgi:hypothetical protein